jgi:hypothetical protein
MTFQRRGALAPKKFKWLRDATALIFAPKAIVGKKSCIYDERFSFGCTSRDLSRCVKNNTTPDTSFSQYIFFFFNFTHVCP